MPASAGAGGRGVTARQTSVVPALVGLTALKRSECPALAVHGELGDMARLAGEEVAGGQVRSAGSRV